MSAAPAPISPGNLLPLNHEAGRRPTHVRYVVMAFLCALSFLTYFDRVCIMRAQNDIRGSLGLTEKQIGLTFSAFWLAYALFEIPSGWLGDRFGTRGTLTRIVIAWSLFTCLSGAAWGFISLLAFRFLFGAGEAGAYPNMAKIQQEWLPVRSRARAGGLLWLLARWGGAFSPFIFGSLLRGFSSTRFHRAIQHVPMLGGLAHVSAWRMGFWVSGLVGVIWVLLFYRFFRDKPADKQSVNNAELDLILHGRPTPSPPYSEERAGVRDHFASGATPRIAPHPNPLPRVQGRGDEPATTDSAQTSPVIDYETISTKPPRIWRDLFTSRSLWAMALLYLCGSFGWNFFVSWMPKFLEDVHGVKFEKSEWISALPLFFGGISCLLGGWLSDVLVRKTGRRRLGRAILPITGCITAAIAIFCICFAHSPTHAVILMCITAAAFDFGQGANWAALIDIGGRYAGTSMGFINMVGNLGNALQGLIGALIFTRFGWPPLFAVYAGAYLIAGGMWLVIDPTKEFYGEIAGRA